MKRFAFLIVPVLLLIATTVSAQPLEVQSYCNLAIPQHVRVFDWSTWKTSNVEDRNVFYQPFTWDASDSIWRGYGSANPFDQPSDAFKHFSVTLLQDNGAEQWIYILDSAQTPDIDYIYVFDNVHPFADTNGNYFGYHPCRAFAADATLVDSWLQQVYQPSST